MTSSGRVGCQQWGQRGGSRGTPCLWGLLPHPEGEETGYKCTRQARPLVCREQSRKLPRGICTISQRSWGSRALRSGPRPRNLLPERKRVRERGKRKWRLEREASRVQDGGSPLGGGRGACIPQDSMQCFMYVTRCQLRQLILRVSVKAAPAPSRLHPAQDPPTPHPSARHLGI